MARLTDGDERYTYSVAWFDSVAAGAALGRAVLTRGRSASRDELPAEAAPRPAGLRRAPARHRPGGLPDRAAQRADGRARSTSSGTARRPATRAGEVQNITTFFHPLDVVGEWNRVYGPRGFLQYQFVVPVRREDTFRRCVQTISAVGHVSFLNVLKRFGAAQPGAAVVPDARLDAGRRPAGPPRAWTGCATRWTSWCWPPAGGCTWPRTPGSDPDTFARMYPRLDEWRKVRDARGPGRGVHLRSRRQARPVSGIRCDRRSGKSRSPCCCSAAPPRSALAIVDALAARRPLRVVLAARPSERLDRGGRRLERRGLHGGDRRVRRPGARHPSPRWSARRSPAATSTWPWSPSACSATRSGPGPTWTRRCGSPR